MKKNLMNSMCLAALGSLAGASLAQAEVTVSGVVEVEAYNAEDYAGAKQTELVAATVELGVDASVNKKVDAHVLFLYEEGEGDSPVVDEATVTYKLHKNASITAGKMYLPFGSYETALVSDPMTLELGEINESAFMYSFNAGATSVSVYGFNGNSDTDDTLAQGDDTDLAFGLNIGFGQEDVYSMNLGYISNIADTESLQGGTAANVDSFVAGGAISFSMNMGNATLNIEHVTAMDSFKATDLGGDAGTSQPSASMIDVGFDMGRGVSFGVGYQVTDEALFLGLPESVVGVALSYEVGDGASLSFEYATADDYSIADGGTGESASQFLVQLAAEF